ncbi:hypothetical protein BC827DRAFT_1157625 [Russula dissimulans]|nr:hypothetical protein BC827DRAFT_1157625 [Russula dissimulans]
MSISANPGTGLRTYGRYFEGERQWKYSLHQCVPHKCPDQSIWREGQKGLQQSRQRMNAIEDYDVRGDLPQVESGENSLRSTDETARHLICSSREVETMHNR